MKYLPILLLFFFGYRSLSQTIRISGNVIDSTDHQPIKEINVTVYKVGSLNIISTAKTDSTGKFNFHNLPIDNYFVNVSLSNYESKTFVLKGTLKDTIFKLKNIPLQLKILQLEEIVAIAYREKIYYSGDTLNFLADSFKSSNTYSAEDLLKKLNGISVSSQGKITVQGKTISRVFVDGDEFFGIDPRIATQNLNAEMIESVQVYEQNQEILSGDQKPTVINLKLKEDYKKGYFGKLNSGYYPQLYNNVSPQFYEESLLLNYFNKKQKYSVYGTYANTPKEAFGAHESSQLDNGSLGLKSMNISNPGIPQTFKTGLSLNNNLNKSTILNTQYNYQANQLSSLTSSNTQFLFADTTYSNSQILNKRTNSENHNLQITLDKKFATSTQLILTPRINYYSSNFKYLQGDKFISGSNVLTRSTDQTNSGTSKVLDSQVSGKVNHTFKKKGRALHLFYLGTFLNAVRDNNIQTYYKYYYLGFSDSLHHQKRKQNFDKTEQLITAYYSEPLSKYLKFELTYSYASGKNSNDRTTLNSSIAETELIDSSLTNKFISIRKTQGAGMRFSYEVTKLTFHVGAEYKNIHQENNNVTNKYLKSTTFNNILPSASIAYRIKNTSRLNLNYNGMLMPPLLQQMQPLMENSDPNFIYIGNPALKAQYQNHITLNYSAYSLNNNSDFFTSAGFSNIINEISNRTTFDSIGRSVTSPININGSYNVNFDFGGSKSIKQQLFKINYDLSTSLNSANSFVNNKMNTTQNYEIKPGLSLETDIDWLTLNFGGSYSYNFSQQKLTEVPIAPYYRYIMDFDLKIKLPYNFNVTSNGNLTINTNRSSGFNNNFFLLNASINKSCLKKKNLIISIEGYDVFGQNINSYRYIQNNRIVDSKTDLIQRYFQIRILYKFNNPKR